jgi:hypothetical protein
MDKESSICRKTAAVGFSTFIDHSVFVDGTDAVTSFSRSKRKQPDSPNAALDSMPNPIQRMNKGASEIFGRLHDDH